MPVIGYLSSRSKTTLGISSRRPPREEREASTMRDVTLAVHLARFLLRGLQ